MDNIYLCNNIKHQSNKRRYHEW